MMRKAITMVVLMGLQFEAIYSNPTTYKVGDEDGWNFVTDIESWTKGKNFHAGDSLVFTYDPYSFDVAVVNQTGHDTCHYNDGATIFHSGNDTIQLVFGVNYFIDTHTENCWAGMKMAINATAPPPPV